MEPITAAMLAFKAIGAGTNIASGAKNKKESRDAERAAKAAMAQAEEALRLNTFKGLRLPMDAFQLASQGVTAGQVQALAGLQEGGQRSLIGGIGSLQAVGIQGQEVQRQLLAQTILDREQLIAKTQGEINKSLAGLDIDRALGAQARSAELEQRGNAQITSGLIGLGSAFADYLKGQDLYGNNEESAVDTTAIDESTETTGMKDTMDMAAPEIEAIPGLKQFVQMLMFPK